MNTKQAYIQLAGDAVIPLAGALFFDWSLYFILVFYCLDLIALEVILQLKSKKTVEFRGIMKKEWFMRSLKSGLLLAILLVLIHVAMYFIEHGIDFKKELFDFITYEEMGIAQGYVLVPFIAFGAYQMYRMNFLMPARFRTITLDEIWRPHFKSLIIMIGFSGLAIGLSQFVIFHDLVYVLSIIVISSAYQLWHILK